VVRQVNARLADEGEPRSGGVSAWKIVFVVSLIALVAAIALPNLIQARKHGNEASAIGALKTIGTSEAVFREGDKENDGNLDYGMLSELDKTLLIDEPLGSGTKQGYLFQATYGFSTSEFLWFSVANPADPGFSGDRYFQTNQAGVIFSTSAGTLTLDTNTCVLPQNGELPGGKYGGR
jgi:hypothetical protein